MYKYVRISLFGVHIPTLSDRRQALACQTKHLVKVTHACVCGRWPSLGKRVTNVAYKIERCDSVVRIKVATWRVAKGTSSRYPGWARRYQLCVAPGTPPPLSSPHVTPPRAERAGRARADAAATHERAARQSSVSLSLSVLAVAGGTVIWVASPTHSDVVYRESFRECQVCDHRHNRCSVVLSAAAAECAATDPSGALTDHQITVRTRRWLVERRTSNSFILLYLRYNGHIN